jgi:hypothetical protein
MRIIHDQTGRRWAISLTVECLRRIKAASGIVLLAAIATGSVIELFADTISLSSVIFGAVESQARTVGVTIRELMKALRGDVLAEGRKALIGEIHDFFPEPDESQEQPAEENASGPENCWQIIYEMAGACGVDPGPFTARELAWMTRGRERVEWNRLSHLLAKVNNVFSTNPEPASTFNPFAPQADSGSSGPEAVIEVSKTTMYMNLVSDLTPEQKRELLKQSA